MNLEKSQHSARVAEKAVNLDITYRDFTFLSAFC